MCLENWIFLECRYRFVQFWFCLVRQSLELVFCDVAHCRTCCFDPLVFCNFVAGAHARTCFLAGSCELFPRKPRFLSIPLQKQRRTSNSQQHSNNGLRANRSSALVLAVVC